MRGGEQRRQMSTRRRCPPSHGSTALARVLSSMSHARNSKCLLIFTRAPVPGSAKTRLIPALGAEGAAGLHADLLRHTLRWAGQLSQQGVAVVVYATGAEPQALRSQFPEGNFASWRAQVEGDLGERLQTGMRAAFEAGHHEVMVVGTDCPGLDSAQVLRAFEVLASIDVVLCPAADGGYYLLGTRAPCRTLFEGISWGSDRVADETRRAAAAAGLRIAELPVLVDIDCPADLVYWPNGHAPVAGRISIILPTWNEGAMLSRTLGALVGLAGCECLVADGGSNDGTMDVAAACGAQVVRSARGRGRQQNAGALAASGAILLFLHADTRLPEHFAEQVRRALADPGVAAGAFRLTFDDARWALRLISWGANLRSRWLGLPYGDQALFVRAETFWEVGGFPDVPLLEDAELVRRLWARGRLRLLDATVVTSARRWRRGGIWKTTAQHVAILLAWCLGVPAARLAAWRGEPPLSDGARGPILESD